MSRELRSALIALGAMFSCETDAAHDLWTWLPSYKVAEKHHGDYATTHTPTIEDVLREAAMYIACLKDQTGRDFTEEEKHWFETCPCGEPHETETEAKP